MISLKDWMNCVNYRISEGSQYLWKCYGDHAHSLTAWDNDPDGVSASVVFDTQTQEVYEAAVYDYARNVAYRLISPEYRDRYEQEANRRGVSAANAWDEVDYVDLETDEDFLEKCKAIMNYAEYDSRVQIPLEMDQDDLFNLMKLAHERDITLNQLVVELLEAAVHPTKKESFDE